MQYFVFGNPDLPIDSLPIRLLPKLQQQFPDGTFITLDPNEEWEVPEHMHVIDTVVGLDEPRIFTDLKAFMAAPRMTCHDFDAYANIMLMKKLGKIGEVTIYGLPPKLSEESALDYLKTTLPV